MTVILIVIDAVGTVIKWFVKGLEELEIPPKSGDYPKYNIIKIIQNTDCPDDWGCKIHRLRLFTSILEHQNN